MGVKTLWGCLIVVILSLQCRLWVGEGSFAQVYAIKKEIELQKVENKRLLERNEKLYAEVLDLKEAQGAIEESARNQLGMIYREETFFWLVENTE